MNNSRLNIYLGPPDRFLPINEHCLHEHNEIAAKCRRFFILSGDSYCIYEIFEDLMLLLTETTGQDTILISLLLVVLIFFSRFIDG